MSPILTRSLFRAGALLGLSLGAALAAADNSATEYSYLSGHGPKDAVQWEFSVYGRTAQRGADDHPRALELGTTGVRTVTTTGRKPVPKGTSTAFIACISRAGGLAGRRVRLVFEGAMTDTS